MSSMYIYLSLQLQKNGLAGKNGKILLRNDV